MTIITNALNNSKPNFADMDTILSEIKSYVETSAGKGTPTHVVEKQLFNQVLQLGKQALQYFFSSQGDGDVGEKITMETGETYKRLSPRNRFYQSLFGRFQLTRTVYGTHESKKIEFIPLDARLQLPPAEHSYILQEWSQVIAVEVPFRKTMDLLCDIFPITMSVDTLEQTNRACVEYIESYREESEQKLDETLENLSALEEAFLKESILVLSADGKGVPIKHERDASRAADQQKNKGPKPDRKRMAVVGASYVVAPYIRTPEEVLEALFIEQAANVGDQNEPKKQRPSPVYKAVIANLTRDIEGKEVNATSATFDWITKQKNLFVDFVGAPPVILMDGQISLWNAIEQQLEGEDRVEILDLLHAISRLWDIAHVFYQSDDAEKWHFMKKRVLRMLKGEIKGVISGARQMATKRQLSEKKLKVLEGACQYLEKNQSKMQYDKYLAQGLPIASGVIEGACRHFVKDRMERAGMQWTIEGAQAMLDVRANKLNGDWNEFMAHRIERDIAKNHPHKKVVQQIEWPMAA